MSGVGAILRDLVFPRRCVFCHRLLERTEPRLCPACAAALGDPVSGTRRGAYYRRWAAALWYEGAVRESFHRYKFGGCRFYAKTYGPLLANAIEKQLGVHYDLMTYIPINALRRRRRGFDQTQLLAQEAGRVLGLSPVSTLKKRRRRPQSQVVSAEERQRNIRGAFRVPNPALVQGKRILLIDDVLTTGATVSEASRVLLAAGAKSVDVATLAAAVS